MLSSLLMTSFLKIYRYIFFPLFRLSFTLLAFFKPKIARGLELRKAHKGKPWLACEKSLRPLWFHCSSGELEYAKPVIRLIKKEYPNEKILVTFFSPSVEEALKNLPDIDFFCPLPWDTPQHQTEFIDYHKPKALMVARTDLWPEMLHQCRRKEIPTLLFSKTVNSSKSTIQRWVDQNLLYFLDSIYVVSEEDRKALIHTDFKKPVEVSGDTRYDQCLYRLKNPKEIKNLKPSGSKKILIMGSSWPADEDIVLPALPPFQEHLATIIAPHEPTREHLRELEKNLTEQNLSWTYYSQTHNWNQNQVLIIDQVGILADLYAWADFSFIGGSFDRGVHSVMESLAQGCLTIMGPKHFNNREALEFKEMSLQGPLSPAQVVQSSTDLRQLLAQALQEWTGVQRIQLKSEVIKKSGASKKILSWIGQRAVELVNSSGKNNTNQEGLF